MSIDEEVELVILKKKRKGGNGEGNIPTWD